MPTAATYLEFLTVLLAMQALPGPESMLVVSRGVGQGRRVAFFTVLGMTVAAGAVQLPLLRSAPGSPGGPAGASGSNASPAP